MKPNNKIYTAFKKYINYSNQIEHEIDNNPSKAKLKSVRYQYIALTTRLLSKVGQLWNELLKKTIQNNTLLSIHHLIERIVAFLMHKHW